jgi:hypothetical protein
MHGAQFEGRHRLCQRRKYDLSKLPACHEGEAPRAMALMERVRACCPDGTGRQRSERVAGGKARNCLAQARGRASGTRLRLLPSGVTRQHDAMGVCQVKLPRFGSSLQGKEDSAP